MGEQKQRRYVTPHRQSRALDSRVLAGSRCMDGQETAGANDTGYHARATGRSVCTSRACQPPGHLWIYRSARLSSPPPSYSGSDTFCLFCWIDVCRRVEIDERSVHKMALGCAGSEGCRRQRPRVLREPAPVARCSDKEPFVDSQEHGRF